MNKVKVRLAPTSAALEPAMLSQVLPPGNMETYHVYRCPGG